MSTELGSRRWSYLDAALYLVGIAGLAASITVLFLGMRAVLDVGGYCAEGGPYVIARHCPDGVAILLPLAIFAGLGSAGIVGWKGAALGGPWGGLVLLAWPGLFISLGWNFLEYAFFAAGNAGAIELGWLIPGVIFVIMGGFPLLGFLPGRKTSRPTSRQPVADFVAEGEARYQRALARPRRQLLGDLIAAAEQRANAGAPAATAAEDDAIVSQLERLDALHRSGTLTYERIPARQEGVARSAGWLMNSSSSAPPSRWFAVAVVAALIVGIAFGYWLFGSLS